MVPALVSIFDFEVTSLGLVTARSVWVGAAFRHVLLYRPIWSDFPLRKQKLGVSSPIRSFAVWHRLLKILLASAPLLISVAPFVVELFIAGFLDLSPEWSDSGLDCRQPRTPHASRVERTRLRKPRSPRTGFSPALCATGTMSGNTDASLMVQKTSSLHHRHGLESFQKNSPRSVRIAHLRCPSPPAEAGPCYSIPTIQRVSWKNTIG